MRSLNRRMVHIVARSEDDLPPARYNGMLAYIPGSGWFAVRHGEWKPYSQSADDVSV